VRSLIAYSLLWWSFNSFSTASQTARSRGERQTCRAGDEASSGQLTDPSRRSRIGIAPVLSSGRQIAVEPGRSMPTTRRASTGTEPGAWTRTKENEGREARTVQKTKERSVLTAPVHLLFVVLRQFYTPTRAMAVPHPASLSPPCISTSSSSRSSSSGPRSGPPTPCRPPRSSSSSPLAE
jgi:hypothetical protein